MSISKSESYNNITKALDESSVEIAIDIQQNMRFLFIPGQISHFLLTVTIDTFTGCP